MEVLCIQSRWENYLLGVRTRDVREEKFERELWRV